MKNGREAERPALQGASWSSRRRAAAAQIGTDHGLYHTTVTSAAVYGGVDGMQERALKAGVDTISPAG
jgi:hypothetical protein